MIHSIHGVNSAAAANAAEPVGKAAGASQAAQPAAVSDSVEISTAARLAAKVAEIPDVRAELVARVKAEIAAGTYETPERMEVAINRLMDDLLTNL